MKPQSSAIPSPESRNTKVNGKDDDNNSSSSSSNSNSNSKVPNWLIISISVGFVMALIVAGSISYWAFFLTKPTFKLEDVSPFPSDTPSPTGGPCLMVTLSSVNPSRSAMRYGDLAVYMSVNDKKTETAYAGGMFQKPKETATWTVVLGGDITAAGAAQGAKGVVRATVPIQWKMGPLVYTPAVKYHVECPMIFKSKDSSSTSPNPKGLILDSRCSVH